MIIIEAKWYMDFWSWVIGKPMKLQALLGLPIIIAKDKSKVTEKNIRHEKIHVRQAIELLYVGFWLIYVGHFVYNLMSGMKAYHAYKNIVFEKEAYQNERTKNYFKWYGWASDV